MFFINSNKKKCGVFELGLSAYEAIKPLGFTYTEDLDSLPQNSLYVFNWHQGTNLKVVDANYLKLLGGKSIGFLHDPYNNPDFFDIKVRLDPDFVDSHPFYGVPRIINPYWFPNVERQKIIVGSFGFGLSHKGFERIIKLVESQLEGAIIRLHIPFSDWCDADGANAKRIAEQCKKLAVKNSVEVTHDYLSNYKMLKWANSNTINIFICDENLVGGISSCVDTALMAQRPLGVNACMQFKHIYSDKTSLEDNSLIRLIDNFPLLQKYREMWTEEAFREKIKCLVEKLF